MSGDEVDLTHGVYRRIYSGFITGQRINKLSLNAEAWFWRVVVTVDDFGNGRADPGLCKDATAGNRKVTKRQVSTWLQEMKDAGLLEFYTVKGESYLHVVGFEGNQPAGRSGRRFKRFPLQNGTSTLPTQFSGNPGLLDREIDRDHDHDHSEIERERAKPRACTHPELSDEEYLNSLQESDEYKSLDVRKVLAKLTMHCEDEGTQPTRRRLLNWLDREDRPMSIPRSKAKALTAADVQRMKDETFEPAKRR